MVNRIDAADNLDDRTSLQPGAAQLGDRIQSPLANSSHSPALTADRLSPLVKRRPLLLQLFCNLPIGQKQALALTICELIPLLGLGLGSMLLLTGNLRTQLVEQATVEAAVTETHYNIKPDQMGSGARGQTNNTVLMNAARTQSQGNRLNAELTAQVRQLLRNETKARKMEYATLVDKDLRIVANANADRQGETFDPSGLVSQVLKAPVQIKASVIVPWSELAKEAPPLPDGFRKQEALIRYVVTPIKDPDTDAVIGALVFGDTVNTKQSIVDETLQTLGGGYSAVYQRQLNGEFVPASARYKSKNGNSADTTNVALPTTTLLAEAAAAQGKTVTQRLDLDGHRYTVAAKAVANQSTETPNGFVARYSDKPAAILVRGTPEEGLNALIGSSVRQAFLVLGLTLLAVALWVLAFRRLVLKPLKQLEQTTQAFVDGGTQRAQVYAMDEVGQLTIAFNMMADRIEHAEAALANEMQQRELQAQQSELLSNVVMKIRQTLNFDAIVQTGVEEIRTFLRVDRVLIYRFNKDYKSGVITTESVAGGWLKALGQTIDDPLIEGAIERYKHGRVWSTTDITKGNLSHGHREILERLQVKANLVAPLTVNGELIGLICAHQCSHPREWRLSDIDFFAQLAAQMSYALDQAKLLQQSEEEAKFDRLLTEVTLKIRQSIRRDEILAASARETRLALNADRVVVYQFNPDHTGTVCAESIAKGYNSILGATVNDPFREGLIDQYRDGRVRMMHDVYAEDLTTCHREILEGFAIRASITAPILDGSRLMGLLCVHQCSAPREWKTIEASFFKQASTQLGFALEQARLFEEKERAQASAELLSKEEQQQTEGLQLQLLQLLGDIEGAASGDLTVRAEVTVGEIGTVADFFNSIVESLRQIVTQVKASALEVNASLGQNEHAMQQLAEDASKQAADTTRTLDSVEQMADSIQTVAVSARQAAAVTRSAATTAEAGEDAMDLTVQNILALRDTISETAKKVKRLGESSQQISKVVSLINQIALQTNLLAINAGIEAARAGEQGQGFAVVAEEVGALAVRSAAATQEIEQIVGTIQRETSEVVEAMAIGTTQVVEGTRLVGDAKQSLGQLLEVSRQIDTLVQSIFNATVSQTQTSEAIAALMRDVVEVSERTSDSSRQVSNSLRQTVEVAQGLQASVGTFKVG